MAFAPPNTVSVLEGQQVFMDSVASTRRMINEKIATPVMLSPLHNVGRPWPLAASMLAAVACVTLVCVLGCASRVQCSLG